MNLDKSDVIQTKHARNVSSLTYAGSAPFSFQLTRYFALRHIIPRTGAFPGLATTIVVKVALGVITKRRTVQLATSNRRNIKPYILLSTAQASQGNQIFVSFLTHQRLLGPAYLELILRQVLR